MDRPPDLNELTELAELERLAAKLEAGACDDELQETPLPPPLGYLPAWWGPVIDEKARQALDTEIDLVELALEHGHDDSTLVDFASDNQPLHQYLVVEKLGVREWSAVYIAVDMLSGRVVVLKISLRETDREGRHVVRVQHSNVVTLHGMLVHEGYPTFVLEWCSQNTLGDYAIRASDWHPVLARVIEGGQGLAFCHERGLVHGDVKPSNFLIGEDIGKLADLGIARTPTTEGPVWGTVFYMAPERMAGVWSFAGDVFAFGLVIEQVLRPFGAIAGEFAALVDKTTAEDPSARPRMDEVLAELQAIISAIDGDRRQLEQLQQREAFERERAELASSRLQLDVERAELASSKVKLRSRMRDAGLVVAVALIVSGMVGVAGLRMLQRSPQQVEVVQPSQPEPAPFTADTLLSMAAAEASNPKGVPDDVVSLLELSQSRAIHDADVEATLRRVAEVATTAGDQLYTRGAMVQAQESWTTARIIYLAVKDHAAVERHDSFVRARTSRATVSPTLQSR